MSFYLHRTPCSASAMRLALRPATCSLNYRTCLRESTPSFVLYLFLSSRFIFIFPFDYTISASVVYVTLRPAIRSANYRTCLRESILYLLCVLVYHFHHLRHTTTLSLCFPIFLVNGANNFSVSRLALGNLSYRTSNFQFVCVFFCHTV